MLTGLYFRLAYPRSSERAYRYLYLLLTAMMLISVVMSAGCSSDTNDTSYTGPTSYRSYTLSEGLVHFSFEYPTNYDEMFTEMLHSWVAATSFRSIEEEGWIIERSYLYIFIVEAGGIGTTDAEAALENEIESFASDEEYSDFEILDRSPVTIAGVAGEQVTFSYYFAETTPPCDGGPVLKLPATLIVRCAYFECNGFVWEIFLQSTEGVADEDEVHFEHILETFTILE
jgi:hypothetical protein